MKLTLLESRDWNTNTDNSKINFIRTIMKENNDFADDPCVGIFWYDPEANELFGVRSSFAHETVYHKEHGTDREIRTTKFMHYAVWQKECNRCKDTRFQTMDYTKYPKGRVFEVKDKGFEIYVGNWITDYPECKNLVLNEFDLPEDSEFIIDSPWYLGHGWSDK